MGEYTFYKPIDKETRKKVWQFAKISKINAFSRMRNKSIPRTNMRFLLLNYFKKCFWCECEVFEYENKNTPNQATVDHVISRNYRKKGDDVLKVLACY